MTIQWLVEPKKGPCFWASMQMLMHYHRLRLGLPSHTEFDSMVDSGAIDPMLHWRTIQPLIERHGLRYAYVSLKEQDLEQFLSAHGPAIYVADLYPGFPIQHTVLITGIQDGLFGKEVIFNDPGSGTSSRLPFKQLFAEHPPYFQPSQGTANKSLLIFYSRTTPATILTLQPKKAAISPPKPARTSPGNVPPWYGNPLQEAVRRLQAEPPAMAQHRPEPATQRWLQGLANQFGVKPTARTLQAQNDPLQEAVRRLQAEPPAMAQHRSEPVTQRWLHGLTTQYGVGPTTQTFQAQYDPLREAVRRLQAEPTAISPMPPRTTYSDIYKRKTYEVDTFGRHIQTGSLQGSATQYGMGSTAQTFQARYDPLREAVRRLGG